MSLPEVLTRDLKVRRIDEPLATDSPDGERACGS
jgi:hypothetical protein